MKNIKKNLLLGICFAAVLFLLSIILNFSFSYMGVSDKRATALVINNYKYFLILYNLKILLAYIVIGSLIGFFCWLLKITKKIHSLLFNIFIWLLFWARAVKLFPQLFLSQLFNRGGVFRSVQWVLTDAIPLWAMAAFFIAVIMAIAIKMKRMVPGLLILAALAGFTIRFKQTPLQAEATTAPNILIFGTDSLRPQSISFNGYPRPTPNIDNVLSRGVHFLNAKASIARTFPVWTSILTSTFPPEHGIRTMYPTQAELRQRWLTLVDILNRRGYFTSIVSDFAGDMFSRAEYGFRKKAVPVFRIQSILKQRSLEIHNFLLGFLINPLGEKAFPEMTGMNFFQDPFYVTEDTKKSVREAVKRKQPFFIVSFSSNNHFPYVSPFPYYQTYADKNYRGEHKYCLGSDMLRSFLKESVKPEDRRQIVALYDGASRLFDDNLGDMLGFLKKCDLERNTIVIVLSDHGENLLDDHYGSGHGDHLRGPFANNMLLGISSPYENFKGRKIKETVRDIDIAPTILSMLGIPIPGEFHGRDLLPAMRGNPFSGLPAYMETGIWYTPESPFIPNRLRAPYPQIMEMLDINPQTGEIILKDRFAKIIVEAKHRAWQFNERKYIYMPGESCFGEEFYVDEKAVPKAEISDPDFLKFREKIIDLFKNRLVLDGQGIIREKY
jgi:hypothetical protein